MLYTKYNTLLVQPIFDENNYFKIIKTLLRPQLQAKPLFMTFEIYIHNVFIHLYKKF